MRKIYNAKTLAKFMSESQLKAFDQEYNDNLERRGKRREATDLDRILLKEYKDGKMMNELARMHRTTIGKISTALRIAALEYVK